MTNPEDEINERLRRESETQAETIEFEEHIVKGLQTVQAACAECPMLAVLVSEMYSHPKMFVN